MRRILVLSVAAVLVATPARADALKEAQQALEMWDPISLRLEDSTLTATLPQRRITDQIYQSALLFGICLHVQHGGVTLSGVRQIEILNQFGAQGYVFEGGGEECAELGELTTEKAKWKLLGMTHLF